MSQVGHGRDVVRTVDGLIRGERRDGMRCFLGVPYAQAPIGDLRWQPPAAVAPWVGTRDATRFGPVCAQDSSVLHGFGHNSETEDCLYLNVFTPETQDPDVAQPVMVWIPGGGLYCGGSDAYDPRALVVDGDVVFVSLNYRVGVFGFFSHPAINAEQHAAGNYGIMDQQAALRWVRNNIAAFGGDPSCVTLFGESAGGISVLAHMASPASEGLFHRAILQSCGPSALMSTPTLESTAHIGEELATAGGCSEQSAEALRRISTRDLLNANSARLAETLGAGQYHIGLVADGTVIPQPMRAMFEAGKFHHVPIINGVNRDEFSFFQALIELNTGLIPSADQYSRAVAAALAVLGPVPVLGTEVPDHALSQILALYPCESYESPAEAMAAVIGDCGFISAGARRTARAIKASTSEVYMYEWDVPDSPVSWPNVSFPYRSAHVQELQYLFPGFSGGGGVSHELAEHQKRLARQMVEYWTTFARDGKPAAATTGGPTWEAYDADEDNVMLLTSPKPKMINGFGARHHCDFWDAIASEVR